MAGVPGTEHKAWKLANAVTCICSTRWMFFRCLMFTRCFLACAAASSCIKEINRVSSPIMGLRISVVWELWRCVNYLMHAVLSIAEHVSCFSLCYLVHMRCKDEDAYIDAAVSCTATPGKYGAVVALLVPLWTHSSCPLEHEVASTLLTELGLAFFLPSERKQLCHFAPVHGWGGGHERRTL